MSTSHSHSMEARGPHLTATVWRPDVRISQPQYGGQMSASHSHSMEARCPHLTATVWRPDVQIRVRNAFHQLSACVCIISVSKVAGEIDLSLAYMIYHCY